MDKEGDRPKQDTAPEIIGRAMLPLINDMQSLGESFERVRVQVNALAQRWGIEPFGK